MINFTYCIKLYKKSIKEVEIMNDNHKKRNEIVLKEAKEMWKNPVSIEQAKAQVAKIKEDMAKDNDKRTNRI
ncbi:MAG: hypothetical protein WBB17_10105 [Saprospiraceae bacterium]|nr:hypothetical protein [Saprospiraceae bacterium]